MAGDTNVGQEISEEVINYLKTNPRIMRKWQSLAHSVGLTDRVEVIKARIRAEGRDYDDHVEEFIREWIENSPERANMQGLLRLLRDLKFNDTALKIETGSYKTKSR